MGIPNFRKFINKNMENGFRYFSFDNMKIKSVCIDISIFLHKYITVMNLVYNGKLVSHIVGLRNQINMFEKLGIDIIYVFDGNYPEQKQSTIDKRSKTAVFHLTDEIIKDTKLYLEYRGIKYIHNKNYEADYICANLAKQKIVDCVYSTDFDILAFGSPCLITNIDYKKKVFEVILLKDILDGLDITYNQFVMIVVLSGCDYCSGKVSITKAYNNINDYSIKDIDKDVFNLFVKKLKIDKKWIKYSNKNNAKLTKYLEERKLKK